MKRWVAGVVVLVALWGVSGAAASVTAGVTGVLGSTATQTSTQQRGVRVHGGSATYTDAFVYGSCASSCTLYEGVYGVDGEGFVAGAVLASCSVVVGTAAGWNTCTLSSSVATGGDVYVMWVATQTFTRYVDSGSSGQVSTVQAVTVTAGTWPTFAVGTSNPPGVGELGTSAYLSGVAATPTATATATGTALPSATPTPGATSTPTATAAPTATPTESVVCVTSVQGAELVAQGADMELLMFITAGVVVTLLLCALLMFLRR